MLCSPPPRSGQSAHLPSHLTSTGSLKYFRRSRKPAAAGKATNCLSCPIQDQCIYSAPRIYYEKQLAKGKTSWPVNIVNPEIESCYNTDGPAAAKDMFFSTFRQDHGPDMSEQEVAKRPWFGRCVWESDNDVCDDQFVSITWDDDNTTTPARGAKTAMFHMIAQTEKQCERRGRIYGTRGEIEYDGTTIRVHDFASDTAKSHHPPRPGGGHGGGDDGLAQQFLKAIGGVRSEGLTPEEAQVEYLGCTLEEIVRSHALVFAAEEARMERKVLDWPTWWKKHVHEDA